MQRAKKAVKAHNKTLATFSDSSYHSLIGDISALLQAAHQRTARSVNAIMTATYWEIGRRIVEFEQEGKNRAQYGAQLLAQLSRDLQGRYGRGFSADNLETMRLFYSIYPSLQISETVSRKLVASKSEVLNVQFPLSWSHYVLLVRRTESAEARSFYEQEALRGGWSVRQLDRQISTQFYRIKLQYLNIKLPCRMRKS